MVQTERRPSQVVTFGSPFGYHQTTVTNIPTRKTSRKRSIPSQSSVISAKKCSVVYRVPIQLEWQPQKVWITTTKAESFYNVNYGSSIIMSKSSSKNLSNQNKHLWWSYKKKVHFGILIHVLSWRQRKHKCLFWLLRFFDELFGVIFDDP